MLKYTTGFLVVEKQNLKKLLLSYCVLICLANSVAQKYNFVNWTVEDGLIQSQASCICQDNYRQLWIGTEGGISKFDGKKFTSYSVQDGLIANDINDILCNKHGMLWVATGSGITAFNGKNFRNVKTNDNKGNNYKSLIEDEQGVIYGINNYKLFRITDFTAKKFALSVDTNERVTALYKTKNNNLLAFVYSDGFYTLQNRVWKKFKEIPTDWKKKIIRNFFVTSNNDTLIITNTGLYQFTKGKIEVFTKRNKTFINENIICIEEDSKNNLWLGTDNGVYKLEEKNVIYFNAQSGFTDNSVNHIYKDAENNLWFATDADGIYKFRENTFTYYDKSSGLQNTIIMGVAQTTNKNIYAAGYGGGLYKINPDNSLGPVKKADAILAQTKINSLYADDENNVWIGTINKGVWKYNEQQGAKQLQSNENNEFTIRSAISFLKTHHGNLLVGSNPGLFSVNKNNTIQKLIVPNNLVITTMKQFSRDCVIVGTNKGIYFLNKQQKLSLVTNNNLKSISVLCLAKQGKHIWIGTTDKGVLNWNTITDEIKNYTTNNGLPSNFIYSIDISDDAKAWIGTGFGISNLQLDNKDSILAIKNFGQSDGLLGMECSHNGLLKANDSSLWFGTTKGLFHFNPLTDFIEKNKPLVLLKSVKLFSGNINDSTLFKSKDTWFNVPNGLMLSSKQNHLTFEFGSIYFTNPEDIIYKYKLEGIDKVHTNATNPYIIYPALPPGKYNLKIIAVTKSGVNSLNEINYPFEIQKAFYQTRFFQGFVIFLLLFTGALTTYIFTLGRQKRKQKAKEQLEKIRAEEFLKLRERTAEDFHDEMGNNLTRISILSDVLKSKINSQ